MRGSDADGGAEEVVVAWGNDGAYPARDRAVRLC
jgi:hypothetical protein